MLLLILPSYRTTVAAVVAAISPPPLGPMEQLYRWMHSLWSTAVVSPPVRPPRLYFMEKLFRWMFSGWSMMTAVVVWGYCSHTILLPHATDLAVQLYPHCHYYVEDFGEDFKNGDISVYVIQAVGLHEVLRRLRICAEIHYPGAEELLAVFRSATADVDT